MHKPLRGIERAPTESINTFPKHFSMLFSAWVLAWLHSSGSGILVSFRFLALLSTQDPASCSGWSLRLSQLLKTKLRAHLTPHMAFPRGEDFLNTAITFRIPSRAALENSSACSSSLLLRGCSFNFVNMLFPACFNCSQKCYYVPYPSFLFLTSFYGIRS